MRGAVLLDTGPLVTYLGAGLPVKEWVTERWRHAAPPMLTCEPVLTEAAFLIKREGADPDAIFQLLDRGLIKIGLSIQTERMNLRALMQRYRNRPMSLADACLVRMAELYEGSKVFTMDADFLIYRKFGNKVIPVMMPEK
jgi:predicted nucleic acid-binding protein